jgi:hypothetical protein
MGIDLQGAWPMPLGTDLLPQGLRSRGGRVAAHLQSPASAIAHPFRIHGAFNGHSSGIHRAISVTDKTARLWVGGGNTFF